MSSSSKVVLNWRRRWRPLLRWALAAGLVCSVGVRPLVAGGLSLGLKHENRHEIDQLENAWRAAILKGDVKTLDGLLSGDYMAITPTGALQSREEALASLSSGRMHFLSLVLTDRKVRFYGATAVVTSLASVQVGTASGPVENDYRYTRVYVRNAQGVWKIVSFEASRVSRRRQHRHSPLP